MVARSLVQKGMEINPRQVLWDFSSVTGLTTVNSTIAASSGRAPFTDVADTAQWTYSGSGSMLLYNDTSTMSFTGASHRDLSFGVWLYYEPPVGEDGTLPGPGTSQTIRLRLGNTAVDFTNSIRMLRFAPEWISGWNYVEFYFDDETYTDHGFFDTMGSIEETGTGMDWALPILGFRIDIVNMPVGAKIQLDSLDMSPRSVPCVILGGDSWSTQWDTTVLPHFESHNMPFYVAAGAATNWDAAKVTRAQTYEVSVAEFINHTVNHLDMADQDLPTIKSELSITRDSHEAIGLTSGLKAYAAPLNSTDALVDQALAEEGFEFARVWAPHWTKPTRFGVANPYRMAARGMSNQLLAFDKQIIDWAILHGCTVCPFFEEVVPGGDGSSITGNSLEMYENDLISLLDYVQNKQRQGLIEVLSPSQYVKRYLTAGR